MSNTDIFARTAANRRRIADFLDTLDETQLATPSLCSAWTVRGVAAHLTMPLLVSTPRFVLLMLRHGGNPHRASEAVVADLEQRPMAEVVAVLRDQADTGFAPAGVGAMGPLTDTCIHLRDMARPLGLPDGPPLDDWRLVLDFLVGKRGGRGFVPKGLLTGLSFRATDQEWMWGTGAEAAGPSEALALAMTGRAVALDGLDGSGVGVLRTRIR